MFFNNPMLVFAQEAEGDVALDMALVKRGESITEEEEVFNVPLPVLTSHPTQNNVFDSILPITQEPVQSVKTQIDPLRNARYFLGVMTLCCCNLASRAAERGSGVASGSAT